jgi:hypothetical protein
MDGGGEEVGGNFLTLNQEGDISKRYHTIFTRVRGSTGGSGKSYPDFLRGEGAIRHPISQPITE